jgi:cell division protein ZapA
MDAPDTNKRSVRVTIFNQTYTITAASDPRETEELAGRVDELMSSIARRAGNLDMTRTAVLACLHLADRLRTVERQLEELRNGIHHKTRDFNALLDQAIAHRESDG